MREMEIRKLIEQDILAMLDVQRECYPPKLLESTETFLNKMRLFAEGSLGCFSEKRLCAYVFFHPWIKGVVVPLDYVIGSIPPEPDCIYIHDLAVLPAYRRKKIAEQLIWKVFEIGKQLSIRSYSLVAVQSSEGFWRRFGFEVAGTLEYAENIPGIKMVLEG